MKTEFSTKLIKKHLNDEMFNTFKRKRPMITWALNLFSSVLVCMSRVNNQFNENQVVSKFLIGKVFDGDRTVYSSIKLENEKTASPLQYFSVSTST